MIAPVLCGEFTLQADSWWSISEIVQFPIEFRPQTQVASQRDIVAVHRSNSFQNGRRLRRMLTVGDPN